MGLHFDLRFHKTQMQLVYSYLMESLSILKHSILHYDPPFLFINESFWPNLLSPGRISQIQKFMKKQKVWIFHSFYTIGYYNNSSRSLNYY